MDDVAPLTLTSFFRPILAFGYSTRRRGSVRLPIFSKLAGMPISSHPNLSVRRRVLVAIISSVASFPNLPLVDVLFIDQVLQYHRLAV